MSSITIDLNPDAAQKLNSYVKAFGSNDLMFEQFIEFHKNRLAREIARIQIDLETFELKYEMKSDDFFQKFEAGDLGDNSDYMVWAGIYELQNESKVKLGQLQ